MVQIRGGISKTVKWQGGGGFRYYHLAPSLLELDKFGNWIISKDFNTAMLAEAMCKHKGFYYEPDVLTYWKHGKSTESDFIYTTTQLITRELVDHIQMQLKEDETLLICSKAYDINPDDYLQITFEKIPLSILQRCEFGRDDYSLKINDIPLLQYTEQLTMFGKEEDV